MARRPRKFSRELYHHIYAWGNNRQAIFITDQHYEIYLNFLERYSIDNQIEVVAYALMQSHIHLFVYDRQGKVSKFMNSLHGEYAQYFNRVTGRVGHVFGERFNNKIVQANEYGLWLSRYIHRQAVEAGLVTDPIYYPWTSYHKYLGLKPSCFVKPGVILDQFGEGMQYADKYEEFVKGAINGPIDWSMKSTEIVGDERFRRAIQESVASECQQELTEKRIYELVIEHFKIEPRMLSTTRGWEEKRVRRKIMVWLINKLGLKPARVARLFSVSNATVHRALVRKR